MVSTENDTSKENTQPQESWGRWGFKHVAGVGVGAVIGAGVGAGYAAYKGYKLQNGAGAGVGLVLLSTPGLGHVIYEQTVERITGKPKFADRIVGEKANQSSKINER